MRGKASGVCDRGPAPSPPSALNGDVGAVLGSFAFDVLPVGTRGELPVWPAPTPASCPSASCSVSHSGGTISVSAHLSSSCVASAATDSGLHKEAVHGLLELWHFGEKLCGAN